jgi:hypothetical protein
VIVAGEVIAQDSEGAQVNRTGLEELENHRKAPRETRGGEPVEGFAFTEPDSPQAVVEHRRTRRLEVQATLLHLRQVCNDPCFHTRAAREQAAQIS